MDYGDIDAEGRIRVTQLADAAAEAAFSPPDGSVAYRVDVGQFRYREGGVWTGPRQETLAWGGDFGGGTGGFFARVDGEMTLATVAGSGTATMHPTFNGGVLRRIAWITQLGDGTSFFDILVNSVVQASFAAGAPGVGQVNVNVPLAAADFIELQSRVGGTRPGQTLVRAWVDWHL